MKRVETAGLQMSEIFLWIYTLIFFNDRHCGLKKTGVTFWNQSVKAFLGCHFTAMVSKLEVFNVFYAISHMQESRG